MSGGGIPLVNVGDVLAGKYQVDRVLGIGGMGMVVAATHLELDQKVAIKFMLPAALANATATERFLREARAVVKLRGEHVCRVFDVGRLADGAPYIVMELMDGVDLSQLLETRTVLPVSEAVDLVLQALEGIAEAHAAGIIHRDLKPANLFIASDSDGSPLVKVLDFGISKSGVGGSATKTGEIMGSPSYMAPEQMQSSKSVTERADIWALGVILYEATSGSVPFTSENLPALCMQVMFDPVPPLQGVSPAFAAIVMRCLAKAPDERFADVGELAMALAPYGSSDAAIAASRIVKVLRRSKGGEPPAAWTLKTVVAEEPKAPAPIAAGALATSPASPASLASAASAVSAVRQSTLSGSASESLRVAASDARDDDGYEARAPRRGWKLGVALVGVAAAAATLGVVGVTSMSKRGTTTSANAPAPAPAAAPAATPAPASAPVVEPPPQPTMPAATSPATTTAASSPAAPATTPVPAKKPAPPSLHTSPTKSPTTTATTTAKPPVASVTTVPPPATTPPATTPPVATQPATPETTPDGKPIYKGTKGKVITTYPTE